MKKLLVLSCLVLGLAVCMGLPAGAATDDRAEVQAEIESGADMPDRARRVLLRARTKREEGDAVGAARVLDDWLTGHPGRDHHLLRFERALDRLALDQPDSALADLQRAVEREPRFARAWLKLGETAYGQGRYILAAQGFGRGWGLTPEPDPELLHYQGVCLLLGGKADQAVAVLASLIRDHRSRAELDWYRALIAADLESTQPGAVASLLDGMVEDFASDPRAWILASEYASSRQQYKAGAVYLTVADYLEPLPADRLRRLGDLYAACGVPLQAARCYTRAVASAPVVAERDTSSVRLWREDQERLASTWLAAHRPDAARAVLQAAVEADPDFGRGYLLLGYSALQLDRPDQARKDLLKARSFAGQAEEASRLLQFLEGP